MMSDTAGNYRETEQTWKWAEKKGMVDKVVWKQAVMEAG